MKQYPIWIDTHNPSYANQFSKSMGVKNSSSSNIKIGTSAKNSYEFVKTRIEHKQADNGSRVYNFFVDDELMKSAFYLDKKMSLVYSPKDREDELKSRYFDKWKKEEEAKYNLECKKAIAKKNIYNNNFRSKQENDKLYNNFLDRLAVNGQV